MTTEAVLYLLVHNLYLLCACSFFVPLPACFMISLALSLARSPTENIWMLMMMIMMAMIVLVLFFKQWQRGIFIYICCGNKRGRSGELENYYKP